MTSVVAKPRLPRWLFLAACPVVLVPFAAWWWAYGGGTLLYSSWQELGPVQVLAGPDEAWLFVETNVVVLRPGWLYEQPVARVARTQEVLVITPQGVKSRAVIPGLKGPTFHPNIGRVFRAGDRFYLLHGQSLGFRRSMFRWQGDRFDLMPLEESEGWLGGHGLAGGPDPMADPALDRFTESNGWKFLYKNNSPGFLGGIGDGFSWCGSRFRFEVERGPTEVRYLLHCIGPGQPWDVVLLETSATPQAMTSRHYYELVNLPEPGHQTNR